VTVFGSLAVDAIVLLSAENDRRVERLWTVDSTLGAYLFSYQVLVPSPGARPALTRCRTELELESDTGFRSR